MTLIGRSALIARSGVKFGNVTNIHQAVVRLTSTKSVDKTYNDSIKKSVFISQSSDIYTNLALEDWFYRNCDFSNHHVLLLWRNDPCVVIGRHQNPWIESNVRAIEENGVALARRNSGGGTVYHDLGNLNLSFFTPRERYDRRYNLDIICRALYREWGLRTTINEREDIVVHGDFKISGTAAKLGRPNAYHHCTLLVNVNKPDLSLALQKNKDGITTNATESVRSFVKNLSDVNVHVQSDKLLSAVGWEYLRTRALTLEDGGNNLVQQQKGFQLINPTEDWFPGITKLHDELCSWNWTYGKTPKFTVTRILETPSQLGDVHRLILTLEVQNGIVEEIKMNLPPGFTSTDFNGGASVVTSLQGAQYSEGITEKIVAAMGCKSYQTVSKSNVAASQ